MNRDFPIDRVADIKPGKSITTYKFIAHNEQIFVEHFPEASVYPGSMIFDCVVSACKELQKSSVEANKISLSKISKINFKKAVTPGDILVTTVKLQSETAHSKTFNFQINSFFEEFCYSNGRLEFSL